MKIQGPKIGLAKLVEAQPKLELLQVPGADALGHFSLLLDEELAAQHEQQRQNKNKSKQF